MIEIGSNSIAIRNVDKKSEAFRKLRNKFSVYDRVKHKFTFSAFVEAGDDIFIPASIGVKEITSLFPNKEKQNLTVKLGKQIKYEMKNTPRDDLQKKAIQAILNGKNSKNKQFLLSLNTGSGKTYIVTNIGSIIKRRIMIFVDTISLAEQWKGEFLKHTTLPESQIAILSGADSVKKEEVLSNKSVYIVIHRTISNLISEDINSINSLTEKLGIGLRIFDEAHVEFKNICDVNALSNVNFTIYLTATPGRSKFTDNSLYAKVFGQIPFFNGKENDEIGNYHTVIMTQFKSTPSITEKSNIKTRYGFSVAKWASYIKENQYEKFAEFLINIIKKFKLTERKTVIILPTLDLIKALKQDLDSELEIDCGVFIGEIKKEEDRQKELAKDLILTNDKIFDKGIDLKGLECLINCTQISSQIKTEQIIGRLRYSKDHQSVLIDVADYGFSETINSMKLRKRFYKKKAKKLIELS